MGKAVGIAVTNITLAISSRRALPRIVTKVANLLATDIAALLAAVRSRDAGLLDQRTDVAKAK